MLSSLALRRATPYLLAMMCTTSATPAVAQTMPAQEQAATIIVEGRRAKTIDRMIADLAPSRGGRQIAKWEWSICVQVVGLEANHATFLRKRIESTAEALKIPVVRKDDCTPNIVVAFTDAPQDVLLDIRKREPELLRDPRYGLPRKSEWEELMAPRPVTWMGRDEVDESVKGGSVSRLRAQTRQSLTKAIAVVDARAITGVTWGQLGDYLCMVTLSRPKLAGSYDTSTILGLFAARDAIRPRPALQPMGMTAIDRSLLANLYTMDGRLPASSQQKTLREKVEKDLAAD